MIRVIPFYFFLFFCILSCQDATPVKQSSADTFFDLKTFFTKEVQNLSALRGFTKTTQINGKKETRQLDTLDLANEFAIFSNADINRVTWLDKYQSDSTYSAQGDLATITYQALTPQMKTQRVHLVFQNQKPTAIQIEQLTDNALMNATMNLEYLVGKSYRIQSNQKLRLAEEREMIVEVELPQK